MLKIYLTELKTLEWWILRSMLDLLVLLNPRLGQYAFDIQERSLKFNQPVCHVKMCSLTFENSVFSFCAFLVLMVSYQFN